MPTNRDYKLSIVTNSFCNHRDSGTGSQDRESQSTNYNSYFVVHLLGAEKTSGDKGAMLDHGALIYE
jgi:hypothetical protein